MAKKTKKEKTRREPEQICWACLNGKCGLTFDRTCSCCRRHS